MGVMDSDMAVCVIQDKFPTSKERSKIVLHLDLKASVESLYDAVAKTYHIPIESFQLLLENLPTAEIVYLEGMKAKTLGESHFVVGRDVRNSVTIFDKTNAIPLQAPPAVESSVFALCIIRDMTTDSCQTKRTNLRMASSSTVQRLYEVVGQTLSYDPVTFDLLLQRSAGRDVAYLKETSKATLAEVGFDFSEDARNMLVVTNKSKTPIRRLGATERPAEIVMDFNAPITATRVVSQAIVPANAELLPSAVSFIKPETIGYVGLVNQAMTCYLNSLLQTLFMTPEFRNAMYRWQFDGNREESVKSIPFQLQKLFVKLQTSNRSAVETTELTRSFGWDSSEAWQQHDIQELCRVMFDALEQKFKRTDQADLIARLYEGKMIDYVKCLDCGIEKMREDTFLDIPLPVRPFGSAVAYPSVEEALRAFVQPELLDGNNQYFCDKCARKCDAHKGLKFSRFPYLLTLHLKRFDFDYNTLHRIKLNDKVTFPEILNLNGFVETAQSVHDNSANNVPGHLVDSTCVISEPSSETQDDDEGIDADAETAASHAAENEKNRLKAMEKGPFVYELFSIMIHSGSASGGHYYAYIKDFGNGEWFCFNDQSVSRITYDDIRRTYGGSATRSYYSGAYSSSTNAYMLMYRQVDKSRNVNFTAKEVFPSHIQGLLQRMEEEEESERIARERERNTLRTKLFCHHPTKGKVELSFGVCKDLSVREVTLQAFEELQLQDVVTFKQCRLVKYDDLSDSPECSFEDHEDDSIGEVLGNEKGSGKLNLLLEIVPPGHAFVVYRSGESSIKVYVVDMETEEIGDPVTLRVPLDATVAQLKEEISVSVATNISKLRLVLRSSQCSASLLLHDEKALKWTGFARNNEVFVDRSGIPEVETTFLKSALYRAIMRFENTIDVHITLPQIDKDSLTRMGITLMSPAQISDGFNSKAHLRWSLHDAADLQEDMADLEHLERRRAFSEGEHDGDDCRSTSPQPASGPSSENEDEGIGDADDGVLHSASEEASLADSDKTLLGDPPEDSFRAPSRTNSPDKEFHPEERDEVKVEELNAMRHIRMSRYHDRETNQEVATVSVDRRLRLSALKWFLGPRLGVHADYLRIYRVQNASGLEKECLSMNETIESCGENPKLVVRLGRALKPGEVRGRVYQLTPNDAEPANFLFEWVVRPGLTIGEAKKEIVDEARTHHDLAWNPQECILRKKNWRNPASIYHNSQIFGTDIAIYTNWEMFFQKLESHQKLDELKKAELTLFTKRWRPSEMILEQFVEVSLPNVKGQTLKEKLSQMSEIPIENLAVAKSPGTFPCEMSVLSIPSKLTWLTEIQDIDEWPLNLSEDGAVLLYKDNTEALKVLSDEERNELASKENLRLNQNEFPTTVASTRKERGLKIYVEPTVKATTETS